MAIQSVSDLISRDDIKGLRVLMRIDVNVPISGEGDEQVVLDHQAWRIKAMVPSIEMLVKAKARVMLLAHVGKDGSQSLRPIVNYFETLGVSVGMVPEWDNKVVTQVVEELPKGGIVLLPNVRAHEGEKKNDAEFGEFLTGLCDVYVNDAFSVSHREHGSIVGISGVDKYAGVQLAKEVSVLEKVRKGADSLVVIVAGAKFGTKLPLIERFLNAGAHVFVGGALAHAIYKARGIEIGKSLFDDSVDVSGIANNERLMVPDEVVVETVGGETKTVAVSEVGAEDTIVDAAPKSVEVIRPLAAVSDMVLWNGPLGWYEKGYVEGTNALVKLLSHTAAETIVGGGDVVTVLEQLEATDKFDFVSTGGGALLDYLVDGTLPGIEALTK